MMAELRLLLWVYAISGAYVLAMLFRRRGAFHPRYALFMVLLIAVSAMGLLLPDARVIAFWAATAGFVLFLIVPGLTVRLARRSASGGGYERALSLGRISYLLLPARSLWRECEFYRGIVSGEIPVEVVSRVQSTVPTVRVRTPVTAAILLAILLMYSVASVFGDTGSHISLIDLGALHGALTFSTEPWRLVTAMFLHAGLLHLGFNVGAIWVLGQWVEPEVGGAGLILVYFLGGIAGGVASVLYYGTGVLSVGASGGAMALVGCATAASLGAADAGRRQRFSSLMLIIGATLFVGVMESGIDNGAHGGGLAFGFVFGLISRGAPRLPGFMIKAAAAVVLAAVVLSYAMLLSDRTAWRKPERFENEVFILERPAVLQPSEEEDGTLFSDPSLGDFLVSMHHRDPPEHLVYVRLEEIENAIRNERPDADLHREGPLPVSDPRNCWRGTILDKGDSPGILYEVYAIPGRTGSGMLTFTLPYGHETLRDVMVRGVLESFAFD